MFRGIARNLPRRALARHGDKAALVIGERSFSYTELERDSNRLANALVGLGVAPGDRVTLYGLNSAEWVIGYHAVAKLGAVINPINVMLTPAEVAFVTRDCEASAILIGPDRLKAFLDVARETPVREVVALGTAGQVGAHDFEALLGAASDRFEPVAAAPDAVATIGYTSGTTGHPKGAMQSQRAVAANIALTATMHVKTAADIVVTALPLPHVYGNVVVNGGLMTGMTVVLLPRFEEPAVLEAIQRPGDDVRGRADDVPVPAQLARARAPRSFVDPLHGRRPDHAGRQDAGGRGAPWLSTDRTLGHDRARRARHDVSGLRRDPPRLDRRRAADGRGADRFDRGPRPLAAGGRSRRADDPRADRDAGLLRQRARRRARRSSRTAGCTPAISPGPTPTATSTSSTAART